jgi:hypothetical protein
MKSGSSFSFNFLGASDVAVHVFSRQAATSREKSKTFCKCYFLAWATEPESGAVLLHQADRPRLNV